MAFAERERELLKLIMQYDSVSVNELLKMQYISKSTLRRDLIRLEEKGLILRTHGSVIPVKKSADNNIPFFMREHEQSIEKRIIAEKAVKYVKDGDVIMLDGTTSACCIVPYLTEFEDIIVITSSAKAAFMLGELNIKNICTGGKMLTKSFSYIGDDALRTVSSYNADIVFFSCRGLSNNGYLSDNSIEENLVRQAMIKKAAKKVFLCNSDKIGNTYLHNLCHLTEVDDIVCETDLPQEILNLIE